MYKVKGKVHEVQTQTGKGEKGEWKRTTLVIETASKYNNLVPISFFNEDISANKGDEVEVDFYVGGREYQGRYFAQLDGNKVEVLRKEVQSTDSIRNAPDPEVRQPVSAELENEEDEDLGLPF